MASNTSIVNTANTSNSANGSANASKETSAAKDGLQEEQELEDMLYRLDQAHIQLRRLRSALPRMLAPLSAKHPSPQAAFDAFTQSIEGTNKEVTAFQAAFLSLHTEGIFARAWASRKENPAGIKQWRATEHPDWADADRKRRRMS